MNILIIISIIVLVFICHMYWKLNLNIRIQQNQMAKKYGNKVQTYFAPLIGIFKLNQVDPKNPNICDHYGRRMLQDYVEKDPETKMMITNFKSSLYVFLTDPDIIKEYFNEKRDFFIKDSDQTFYDLIGSHSLSQSEGNRWKFLRRITAPFFHFNVLEYKIPLVQKHTKAALEEIMRIQNKGEIVNSQNIFEMSACRIFSEIFFGEKFSYSKIHGKLFYIEMKELVNDLIMRAYSSKLNFIRGQILGHQKTRKTPSWMFTADEKAFIERIEKTLKHIDDEIERRLKLYDENPESKENDDYLQMLFKLYRDPQNMAKSDDDETKVTPLIISHQFITLFFGGMDATSAATNTMAYNLAENPEMQEKIRQEIYDNVDLDQDQLCLEDLNKLTFLDAFNKESLRIYPVASGAFMPRTVLKDVSLGGIELKKGWRVGINILGLSNSPKYFNQPTQFRPERWLGEEGKSIHPFAYLPFLGGRRNCIGQHFAIVEMKMIAIYLVTRFKLTRTDVPYRTHLKFQLLPFNGELVKYTPTENGKLPKPLRDMPCFA